MIGGISSNTWQNVQLDQEPVVQQPAVKKSGDEVSTPVDTMDAPVEKSSGNGNKPTGVMLPAMPTGVAKSNGASGNDYEVTIMSFPGVITEPENTPLKAAMSKLENNAAYKAASADVKAAMKAMVEIYPQENVVDNLATITNLGWFKDLSVSDQQAACRLIAAITVKNDKIDLSGDNAKLYPALKSILDGSLKLSFADTNVIASADSDNNQVILSRDCFPGGLKPLTDRGNEYFDESITLGLGKQFYYVCQLGLDKEIKTTVNALHSLEKTPGFDGLESKTKLAIIDTLLNEKGSTPVTKNITGLISNSQFQKLDPQVQNAILDKVLADDDKAGVVDCITKAINTDWFKGLKLSEKTAAVEVVYQYGKALETAPQERKNTLEFAYNALLNGELKEEFSQGIKGDIAKYFLEELPAALLDKQPVPTDFSPVATQFINSQGFQSLGKSSQLLLLNILHDSPSGDIMVSAFANLFVNPGFMALNNDDRALLLTAIKHNNDPKVVQGMIFILNNCIKSNISGAQRTALLQVIEKTGCKIEMMAQINSLAQSKTFAAMSPESRETIFYQFTQYPDEKSISNLIKTANTNWFAKLDVEDQQRAAKCIGYMGYMAANGTPQQAVILNNTLERIFAEKTCLVFTTIKDEGGGLTMGYTYGDSKIYINNSLVPAGNKPAPVDDIYFNHAALQTICHETSHQVNQDHNNASYKYFQAEFRAWYVGMIAETGVIPTAQQAYDRCVSLIHLYPSLNTALHNNNKESEQIIAFMAQVAGVEFTAKSKAEIDGVLKLKVNNGQETCLPPDPAFNPDLDN